MTVRHLPMPLLRLLGQGLLQLVYPAACHICLAPIEPSPLQFCGKCVSFLRTDNFSSCWRCCATIGPHEDLVGGCSRCRDASFQFSRAYRFGVYDGLLREVVLRMKSQQGESLAAAIGTLFGMKLAPCLVENLPDGVLAMPLHWRRRVQRGYNQSETLARSVGQVLKVPYWSGHLVRTRQTRQQVGLSAAERRANVRGAFAVRRPAPLVGKRVLLMDDVLTTSSTANEAAGALRAVGAAEVFVGVLTHRAI